MYQIQHIQLQYLNSHQFYTNTAKSLRQIGKEKQIERLKKIIENANNQ